MKINEYAFPQGAAPALRVGAPDQPDGERRSGEQLDAQAHEVDPIELADRRRPLGEQGLVLGAHRQLGAVRLQRREPLQRIQVEAVECARVGLPAQVPVFLHPQQGCRQAQDEQGGEDDREGALGP